MKLLAKDDDFGCGGGIYIKHSLISWVHYVSNTYPINSQGVGMYAFVQCFFLLCFVYKHLTTTHGKYMLIKIYTPKNSPFLKRVPS